MRVRRDEDGAVAVVVALCAFVLFAGAAYAVDAGNAWQTRRNLVTATDAAALASAGENARAVTQCGPTSSNYLDRNLDGASLAGCNVHNAGSDHGWVEVEGAATADYTFAGIFGIDDAEIGSMTTAEWGKAEGVRGLRPMGLCLGADAEFTSWLNLPSGPTGQSSVIRIEYTKAQPDVCGEAPGNWGLINLGNQNGLGNSTVVDWIEDGYPGEVSVGDILPPKTGAFHPSFNNALDDLVDSGAFFGLPVYDTVTGPGNNAQYRIAAFVLVKLVGFRTTGAEPQRYLDLVFDTGVLEGSCCGNGIDTGVRVLRICDVNDNPAGKSDC